MDELAAWSSKICLVVVQGMPGYQQEHLDIPGVQDMSPFHSNLTSQ
jgi:hypothetical protein